MEARGGLGTGCSIFFSTANRRGRRLRLEMEVRLADLYQYQRLCRRASFATLGGLGRILL